ncbi:hypothetical protein Cgig2_033574 [Carnegiea gigantea]|uniref:Uncharacterized protein n=1 Tax=Carnegiea gigantea TaxID=171969 RepID=A0A9Q1KNP9_9CARY|nr:hypothetical protein Cgig2_033574 [Carnegiea gigantea]
MEVQPEAIVQLLNSSKPFSLLPLYLLEWLSFEIHCPSNQMVTSELNLLIMATSDLILSTLLNNGGVIPNAQPSKHIAFNHDGGRSHVELSTKANPTSGGTLIKCCKPSLHSHAENQKLSHAQVDILVDTVLRYHPREVHQYHSLEKKELIVFYLAGVLWEFANVRLNQVTTKGNVQREGTRNGENKHKVVIMDQNATHQNHELQRDLGVRDLSFLVWNVQGIDTRIHEPSVLGLVEIHTSGRRAQATCAKIGFDGCHSVEAQTELEIEIVDSHNQYMTIEIKRRSRDSWLLTVVYASPHLQTQEHLWAELQQFAMQCGKLWLLAGDFNETIKLEE